MIGLLAAPFAAGLVVLATHVPLGITVLRRGIIFIDLAVAQVAALGVIVAGLAHLDEDWGGFGTQLAAGIAALAAAALLTFCERRWPDIQEALIGLLFVFAAAAGIVLLAGNPHGGEHLRDLLAGQILWAGWGQIGVVAALSAAVLAGRAWLARRGGGEGFAFYALFAVAVTASVQLVGVLLVFASLIAPAVATSAMSAATAPCRRLSGGCRRLCAGPRTFLACRPAGGGRGGLLPGPDCDWRAGSNQGLIKA
jgi:zinc/manganese transport system permease protein